MKTSSLLDFPSDPAQRGNGVVRLRTLILLRWLAVFGQGSTILVANLLLKIQIELDLCVLAIGASVLSNLVASFVYPENHRLPERDVFLTLFYDVSQLAFLLYLTGGLNNPFSIFVLAPVTISAMMLRRRSTIFLGSLVIFLMTIMTVYYVPLKDNMGAVLHMPHIFLAGFWVALVISVIFLAVYAGRVTAEARSMSQALLATQMALAREQKLTDLGGVVAATAHELGTPLATIKLVSSELLEELSDQPLLQEDAALIREQAERCRDILHSMGRAGKDDLHLRTAPLSTVIKEAAEPHSKRGKVIEFSFSATEGCDDKMPMTRRKPEVIHGLRNLIQNAVDFADQKVWVDAKWSDLDISVQVVDDGPGYPPGLIGRIGDPFLKRRNRAAYDASRPAYAGMGLGLFIAKTLLERAGAEVFFANGREHYGSKPQAHERCGAIANVTLPRDVFSTDAQAPSKALGENKPISI